MAKQKGKNTPEEQTMIDEELKAGGKKMLASGAVKLIPEGEKLKARLDNIEKCLAMMAHMTGQQRVLDKFGIPRWEVTKESMQKGGG